jgi:hypothetical protein
VLEEFLETNDSLFADDYLVLKIDIETMTHGDEVGGRLRGARGGGIPWITILDGDGMELVTSDGPDGNIGCPITEQECAYFIEMLEKTVQHAPPQRITEITKALEEYAQPKRAR